MASIEGIHALDQVHAFIGDLKPEIVQKIHVLEPETLDKTIVSAINHQSADKRMEVNLIKQKNSTAHIAIITRK